jgi:hypothetical protein
VAKRHIAMVMMNGRVRCSCELHACPSLPRLGDPLCQFCRQHCYGELIRRERFRRRVVIVAAAVVIFVVSWLAGHFIGPAL